MKKVLFYVLSIIFSINIFLFSAVSYADGDCKGIKLNTKFPLIGNCINTTTDNNTSDNSDPNTTTVNDTNAFPVMIGALTKIIASVIIIVCFIMLIVAGIKMSSDDPKGAKAIIIKVARTIGLLGLSGIILRLINPTFFG